jgi:hypothetical protein
MVLGQWALHSVLFETMGVSIAGTTHTGMMAAINILVVK